MEEFTHEAGATEMLHLPDELPHVPEEAASVQLDKDVETNSKQVCFVTALSNVLCKHGK